MTSTVLAAKYAILELLGWWCRSHFSGGDYAVGGALSDHNTASVRAVATTWEAHNETRSSSFSTSVFSRRAVLPLLAAPMWTLPDGIKSIEVNGYNMAYEELGHRPQRPDWLAGVVGLELRNPSAIRVFEML